VECTSRVGGGGSSSVVSVWAAVETEKALEELRASQPLSKVLSAKTRRGNASVDLSPN
jgi:hypothetical protein